MTYPWSFWLFLVVLSLMCLATASRKICFLTFLETEDKLVIIHFSFIRVSLMSAFFYPLGTSSSHHKLLKMIKSRLTTLSNNSLSTLGFILSGPTDLCMLALLKWFLTWSSSNVGNTSLLQTVTSRRKLGIWGYILTTKMSLLLEIVRKKKWRKQTGAQIVFILHDYTLPCESHHSS